MAFRVKKKKLFCSCKHFPDCSTILRSEVGSRITPQFIPSQKNLVNATGGHKVFSSIFDDVILEGESNAKTEDTGAGVV